jgi:hypothetical protein
MQVLRITANGRLFRCAATGSSVPALGKHAEQYALSTIFGLIACAWTQGASTSSLRVLQVVATSVVCVALCLLHPCEHVRASLFKQLSSSGLIFHAVRVAACG